MIILYDYEEEEKKTSNEITGMSSQPSTKSQHSILDDGWIQPILLFFHFHTARIKFLNRYNDVTLDKKRFKPITLQKQIKNSYSILILCQVVI